MIITKTSNLLLRLVNILLDSLESCSDIILEQLLLLLGFAASVGRINFIQVLLFLIEKHLSLLNRIVQVTVSSDFFSFHIQVIEQLHKTFVELSDLNF